MQNKFSLFMIYSIFLSTNAFPQVQVTYDKKVIEKYNRARQNLPEDYKRLAEISEKDSSGPRSSLVIVEIYKDDTLNKVDFQPADTVSTVTIFNPDGSPQKTQPDETFNDLKVMFVYGLLNSDTLDIHVNPGPLSEQSIGHKVIKNKVTSTYNENYKRDKILRRNISTMATNDLLIPAKTIKFVLSDKRFSEGKMIYDEAEIITDAFYYLAANGFKNNTITHRLHFKYLFKLKPNNNKLRYRRGL